MVFEDGDHTTEIITVIINDIERVYSPFPKHEVISVDDPPRNYLLDGRQVPSNRRIIVSGLPRYMPDALIEYFGNIVRHNEKDHLVISTDLINTYKKALKIINNDKNALKALDVFIKSVNVH